MEKAERWLDSEEASLASEGVAVGVQEEQEGQIRPIASQNSKLSGSRSFPLLSSYHQS